MIFNSEAGVDEETRLFTASIFLCTCIYSCTAVHALKNRVGVTLQATAVKTHCKAENRSLEESPRKEMI